MKELSISHQTLYAGAEVELNVTTPFGPGVKVKDEAHCDIATFTLILPISIISSILKLKVFIIYGLVYNLFFNTNFNTKLYSAKYII